MPTSLVNHWRLTYKLYKLQVFDRCVVTLSQVGTDYRMTAELFNSGSRCSLVSYELNYTYVDCGKKAGMFDRGYVK